MMGLDLRDEMLMLGAATIDGIVIPVIIYPLYI